MTKRVLSMLLALIMALSLCVPAFAADEPEVSADEPATTAVDEPAPVAADEPAPAVADPEHLDERALQGAVDKAAEMEPGVIRGEYQDRLGDWPDDYSSGGYPATVAGASKYFMDKLAAARNVLASIKAQGGYVTWMAIPGNSDIYEAALKGLQTAVNLLTKYVRPEQITELKGYETWYKKVIDENTAASYGIGTYDTQPWFETAVKEALAFQQGMTGYADGEYTGALYKDYVAAEATHKTLADNSTLATLAEYTDYIELRDAIADARAKLAGDAWFDGTAYPDLNNDTTLTGHADLTKAMAAMENYFSSTSDTGFIPNVTLREVHFFLSTIKAALKANKHTLDIDAFYITTDYKTVQAVVKKNSDWENDCRDYHLEISSVSTLKSPAFTARGIANGHYSSGVGVFVLEASPTQLGINDSGKLKDGSVITVKLICDKGGEVVDEKTITVDANYNGPVIDKATYTPDSITVKLNKSLFYANGGTHTTESPNNQYDAATLTLSYGGKVVDTVTLDKTHGTDQYDAWTFNLKPVQLGDYTIELKVKEGKTSGHNEQWISRDTETVNVPDITTYVGKAGTDAEWGLAGATGYPNLQKAIEACSDTDAMFAKNGMTETLRTQLENSLKAAQDIVAKASVTPLSVANKAKVDAAIAALYGVLKNFEAAADPTALKTAIANGEALIASDYNSVTAWKALQDALAEGKDLEKQLPLSKTAANEGKIAAKAAAINAAIKELTDKYTIHPATELAALKALIDGVPAQLNADDWTTESKNAVLAAVAEVQPLLTKTGVKKSEVSAAIDKLQAALSALSTEEPLVVPAAPAGGTGWVLNAKGQWFYYYKGVLQKGWMMSSKSKLWYWLDPETGVMATGFQSIEGKWYYFTESGDCIGSLTSGWQKIGTYINSKGQVADNWGWFYTKHDGHFGECTYTYEWGDL